MDAGGILGRLASGPLGRAAARLGGTTVWEREWDVCCVLDGCRLDAMAAVAPGYDRLGEVGSLWSVGSQSAEWMDRTFAPDRAEEMSRTAYLTGNPFSAQPADHIASVRRGALPLDGASWGLLYEAWEEEWVDGAVSTVPPGPLTDAAIAVWTRREALGIDRVLVHYMQPHAPFRSRPEWFLGDADTDSWGRPAEDGDEAAALADLSAEELAELERLAEAEAGGGSDATKDPWTRLRDGAFDREAFFRAYRDNLRWAIEDLTRLLDATTARVALTSDHGNAAGEWGLWSHPPGVPAPVLRRVPWVRARGTGERRADPSVPGSLRDAMDGCRAREAPAGRRLADLGYR